jgi:SseB protein N-terminal domain
VPAGVRKSQLEVQLLADGTRTLPVFSSVARLVDEMGPHQAWVCLPMRAAAAAANRAAVDRVTLDPVLGRGAWPPRLSCATSTLRCSALAMAGRGGVSRDPYAITVRA